MAFSCFQNDDRLRRWSRSSEALIVRVLMGLGWLVRLMSRPVSLWFARLLGDFMHHILRLRRHLVYGNLALTFPEKSREELKRIATGVYRNLAVTFIDVFRFPLIKGVADVESLIDINLSPFWLGTDQGRKGAVMVSGHYGNWELMAMAFGMKVKPMTILVKELSNKPLDLAINRLRTLFGNRVIYSNQAVREGLRLLNDGAVLAILADQSDPSGNTVGEFLGRKATMFQGAAFFALRANVPLFVGMCRHGEDGRYSVEVREIETSDLTCSKADIAILAARYTKVIEEYVLKWPEEWFWLHNRWKNVPSAEEGT